LGIPPEFIGTGRGLLLAQKEGMLETVEKLFPTLRHELAHAGKYINRENLELLSKQIPELENIKEDIDLVEKILKIKVGPILPKHFIHRNMTSSIYYKWKMNADFLTELEEAAVMRRSLG
jgi:phosphoenolpyruvate carboxylase